LWRLACRETGFPAGEDEYVRPDAGEVYLEARQVRGRLGQFPSVLVVLLESFDVVLGSYEARGGQDARLAHPPAEAFPHLERFLHEGTRTGHHRADRGAQTLRETEHHLVVGIATNDRCPTQRASG